jgi:HEAT repeat protein
MDPIDSYVRSLREPNENERLRGVEALVRNGKTGDPRAVEALYGALDDPQPRVRSWAAQVLLAVPDENVRRRAAVALGMLGDPRAVEVLCGALGDPNEKVRLQAVEGLGKIGDPRAVEVLCGALRDPGENVRWQAAEALGKIRRREALPSLRACLRWRLGGGEKSDWVRQTIHATIETIEQATKAIRSLPLPTQPPAPATAQLPRPSESAPEPGE